MNTAHEQVEVELGGKITFVDVRLAKIIEILNKNGYQTFCSCQDSDGKAYIRFETIEDCQRYLDKSIEYCRKNNDCECIKYWRARGEELEFICKSRGCGEKNRQFLWFFLLENIHWGIDPPRACGGEGEEKPRFSACMTFDSNLIDKFEKLLLQEGFASSKQKPKKID